MPHSKLCNPMVNCGVILNEKKVIFMAIFLYTHYVHAELWKSSYRQGVVCTLHSCLFQYITHIYEWKAISTGLAGRTVFKNESDTTAKCRALMSRVVQKYLWNRCCLSMARNILTPFPRSLSCTKSTCLSFWPEAQIHNSSHFICWFWVQVIKLLGPKAHYICFESPSLIPSQILKRANYIIRITMHCLLSCSRQACFGCLNVLKSY